LLLKRKGAKNGKKGKAKRKGRFKGGSGPRLSISHSFKSIFPQSPIEPHIPPLKEKKGAISFFRALFREKNGNKRNDIDEAATICILFKRRRKRREYKRVPSSVVRLSLKGFVIQTMSLKDHE